MIEYRYRIQGTDASRTGKEAEVMAEFISQKSNIIMCYRMLNSRAYNMAGVQSCAHCVITGRLDTMHD